MTTEWSQGFGSIVPGPRVETGCGNEVLDMAIAPPKCLDISKRLLAGGDHSLGCVNDGWV